MDKFLVPRRLLVFANSLVLLLQMSLASSRKSIKKEKTIRVQPEKISDIESPRYFDCEDTSFGHQSPNGGALITFPKRGSMSAAEFRDNNCGDLASPLVKEFEQKKHTFDDEARAIIKIKSLNLPWVNSGDELQNLKQRFVAWKLDFKGRLKEAKSKVQKPGSTDGDKNRRKW